MPKLAQSGDKFAAADSCGKCHEQIYQEWTDSPHARAYSNPRFKAATDDYQFSRCLGCHAPEPKYHPDRPKVRMVQRQAGISCVVCHLEESKLVGPVNPSGLVAPHPVKVKTERYRDSRFCGRCHEGTLTQWQQAKQDDKLSCQECHMPALQRKLTQPSGLVSEFIVAFEKPTATKRHSFDLVPEKLPEEAVSAEVVVDGLQAVLTVHNHLPHALPTGDFGMRIVAIEAEVMDSNGQISPVQKWELTSSGRGALPARSSLDFPLAVCESSRAVRVRLLRFGQEGANAAVLLEKEFLLR